MTFSASTRLLRAFHTYDDAKPFGLTSGLSAGLSYLRASTVVVRSSPRDTNWLSLTVGRAGRPITSPARTTNAANSNRSSIGYVCCHSDSPKTEGSLRAARRRIGLALRDLPIGHIRVMGELAHA
jgi:hypothetical protein